LLTFSADSEKFRYTVQDFPYDEQSAFAAIGHQLQLNKYKSEGDVSGAAIRHEIVDFMSKRKSLKDYISEQLEEGGMDNVQKYFDHMAKDSTPADVTSLFVASLLYKVRITIYYNISTEGNFRRGVDVGSWYTRNRGVHLGLVSRTEDEPATHFVSLVPSAGMIRHRAK